MRAAHGRHGYARSPAPAQLDRLEQPGKRDDIPGLAALYTDLHHKGIGKAEIAKVLPDTAAAGEPAPAPEAPACDRGAAPTETPAEG